MKLVVNYFDNEINFDENYLFSLEIENKKYFYRFVKDIFNVCEGKMVDDLSFVNDDNCEINMSNKIKVFNDYFNFDFDSKKYSSDIVKYLINNIADEEKDEILSVQRKMFKVFNKELNNVDLPLAISIDESFETLAKNLKIVVKEKEELIDNLFLIIDLEKLVKSSNILVFINLKYYLSDSELNEFCKYAVYNEVKLLFIDCRCYGISKKLERKLIIDENLDEFML